MKQLIFISLLFVSFISNTATASLREVDYLIINSKDADELTNSEWMHLLVKIENSSNSNISLKNTTLKYAYTDDKSSNVIINEQQIYWYSSEYDGGGYENHNKNELTLTNIPNAIRSGEENISNLAIQFNGGELVPGECRYLQFAVRKSDWSTFNELDDPSYSSSYAPDRLTLRTPNIPITRLADFDIAMTFDADAAHCLSATSLLDDFQAREITRFDDGSGSIVEKLLTQQDVLNAAKSAFGHYSTIIPEINYNITIKPTKDPSDDYHLEILKTHTSIGVGATGGSTRTRFGLHPRKKDNVTGLIYYDKFYHTGRSSVFTDRDDAYHTGLYPWLKLSESDATKNKYAKKTFHGYSQKWMFRHEFGHGLCLPHPSVKVPDPNNPGSFIYLTGTWKRNDEDTCQGVMFEGFGRSYNSDAMMEWDVRGLENDGYKMSYPNIAKHIVMKNYNDDVYESYITSSWLDANFRMYETDWDPSDVSGNSPEGRYYSIGLDSVCVSPSVGDGISGNIDGLSSLARIKSPKGLFVDKEGYAGEKGAVYFNSWGRVKKLSTNGVVSNIAGSGILGYQNGSAQSAQFSHDANPFCVDKNGNIYVCENTQSRIRKITPAGTVELVAGSESGERGYINGFGSAVRFSACASLAYDEARNLIYIVEYFNHTVRTLNVITGEVSSFAGTADVAGNVNGSVSSARFSSPTGVAYDEVNDILYVSDNSETLKQIRAIDLSNNTVSTIAGGTPGYADGIGTSAKFGDISDFDVDEYGRIWIADGNNYCVRLVTPSGEVTTVAGTNTILPNTSDTRYKDNEKTVSGSQALFRGPVDVACDEIGNVYISDMNDHRIRKLSLAIPLTVNAPAVGKRLNHNSSHFYNFYVSGNEVDNYSFKISNGGVLNCNFKATLYKTDDQGNEAVFNGTASNLNFNKFLNEGNYVLKIEGIGTSWTEGACFVRLENSKSNSFNNEQAINGYIHDRTDNDWYQFSLSTSSTVTVSSQAVSFMMDGDINIGIYGNLLSGFLPTLRMKEGDGSVTATLPAGDYWVRVKPAEYKYSTNNDSYPMGGYSIQLTK